MNFPRRAEHDRGNSPEQASSSSLARWWSNLLGAGKGTKAGPRAPRHLIFETCEPRIVFTAQPVAEFFVDYFIDNQLQNDLHTNVANGDAFTGLSRVRDAYGLSGQGQTVVVIDTGIAYDHQALGGGYGAGSRVVGGYDFAQNDANPYDSGPHGSHGTHVAGIIGSSDSRYPGLAPEVDLVALRVFNDQGAGRFDWVERALQWVVQHRNSFRNPITTINLSIGSTWNGNNPPSWAMLEDEFSQLKSLGIFTSVAAGNSFTHYNTPGLSYPAASNYVVPVASVDNNGQLSYFSQRNSRVIAAPGRSVVSTVPDYVGNLNGRTDDFAAFSGTSMAAPYVAGASVLIREAYAFAGITGVTQDTIYNLMVNTADTIYDSATNQSYKRLNLERALQAIMPTDDYGSTADAAHQLGTIVSTASVDGTIGRLDDRDFFRFTAGSTGRVTLTANRIDAAWQYGSSGANIQGNRLSFDVVAGQTYTFGLGSGSGIGHYTIDVEVASTVKNWGATSLASFQEAVVPGNNEFQLAAQRNGILSVDASFARAAGNITLQVYDHHGNLVGSSSPSDAGARVDVQAQAGQMYRLRAVGTNADVTFRVANVVATAGDTVYVHGTAADEQITFWAGGTHRLRIGGIDYEFGGAHYSKFHLDGGQGIDVVTLIGDDGNDHATLIPGAASMIGQNYRVDVRSAELIVVDGRGGDNRANIFDTAWNDTVVSRPNYTQLLGPGVLLRAVNFNQVDTHSTRGNDSAVLHGSSGNDHLAANIHLARMSDGDYLNRVHRFASVHAHGGGGDDRAHLIGSSGNDTFTGTTTSAHFTGPGFNTQVSGFGTITVLAGGGVNQAVLNGSAGNDTYVGRPRLGQLTGPGYNIRAFDFQQVRAVAGNGGTNQARLYDSPGNDTLIARPDYSRLFGQGFEHYVFNFSGVEAQSIAGGIDRGYFYDASGNGKLTVNAHLAEMLGKGFHNRAINFQVGTGLAGVGANQATLLGVVASRAQMHDVALEGQATGDGNLPRLSTRDVNLLAYGIQQVWAQASADRMQGSDAVDYVFDQWGS